MSRPEFDAVIFDLDGTLVDSRVAVIDAVSAGIREAVLAAGEELPSIDPDRLREALGKPADEYFRAILPPTLGHLAAAVKTASTAHEVEAFRSGRGTLFPQVLESLDLLVAGGVRIGVISNAQAPYFHAALDYSGLGARVTHRECYEELPPGSPRPFKVPLLRRALDRMGVVPARALMVGDRAEDLEAGISLGCSTLAIPFGFGSASELAIADRQLGSYSELASVVGL